VARAGRRNEDWYGSEKVTIAVKRAERRRTGQPNIVPIIMPGVVDDQIPFGLNRAGQIVLECDDFDAASAGIRRAYDHRLGDLRGGIFDETAARSAQSPVVIGGEAGTAKSTTTGR